MIKQTLDPTFLNEVANHPDVRASVGEGDHDLDLSPLVRNPANLTLVTEHGGWVFVRIGPGLFEVHSLFLKAGRGREFLQAARMAMRWLFTRTECIDLVTKCPDDNGGARMAASLMGFRERYRRDGAWHTGAGISYQGITIEGWALRDDHAGTAGGLFHKQIEYAKEQAGSEMPVHPDDDTHDRIAGAALMIALAGNLAKGVEFYNRWASFAGYGTIALVAPGLVDIGDAIVQVKDGQTEVLLCR